MNVQDQPSAYSATEITQFSESIVENSKLKLTFYRLLNSTKIYALKFNIFNNRPRLNVTSHEIHNEIYSTRLFIFLSFIFLTIFMLFSALSPELQTVTISKINQEEYEKLYQNYSETLQCSCKKISIAYQEFSSIQPIIHPICSSIYITDEWFSKYLPIPEGSLPHIPDHLIDRPDHFRKIGPRHFQLLSLLCNLTNRTIYDSLIIFNSTTLINSHVLSFSLFHYQTQSFIDQFISSTINTFIRMVDTIVTTTQNMGLLSESKPIDLWWQQDNFVNLPSTNWYQCSSCQKNINCLSVSVMQPPNVLPYLASYVTLLQFPYYIVGWYGSCSVMNSLMVSNFECFFSQECLDQIAMYMFVFNTLAHDHATNNLLVPRYPPPMPFIYKILNSSKLIRSTVNISIKEIIQQLMVESWNSKISYSNYFSACEPTSCTYTHMAKRSFLSIVSQIIGFIGGLTTILKFILPTIVTFFRRNKKIPSSSSSSSKISVRRYRRRTGRRVGCHSLWQQRTRS